MRQQFPFYKSFDDVAEDLTDTQLAKYIRTLLDVQFLRIKIEDVTFKDKMLALVWKSQKHSIQKSINGFLDGQKRDTIKNPYFGAYVVPAEGINEGIQTPDLQVQCKEEVKEECKGKGEVQVCMEFTFTLDKQKLLSTTSKEYQSNLKDYISNAGKQMTYEDFYNQCEMKPYKYKNFKMAYDSWTKKETQQKPQNQISFKQQDENRAKEKSDNIAKLLNAGFDPFSQDDWNKLSQYELQIMQEHHQGVIDV